MSGPEQGSGEAGQNFVAPRIDGTAVPTGVPLAPENNDARNNQSADPSGSNKQETRLAKEEAVNTDAVFLLKQHEWRDNAFDPFNTNRAAVENALADVKQQRLSAGGDRNKVFHLAAVASQIVALYRKEMHTPGSVQTGSWL